MMKPDELAAAEYASLRHVDTNPEVCHLRGQAHALNRCEGVIETAYLALDSIAAFHIPNATSSEQWIDTSAKKLIEIIVTDTIKAREALAEIAKLRGVG